jgi:hypothetical protein
VTIAPLLNIACTIAEPGTTTDVYGDVVTDYDTGTTTSTSCYLAAGATSEATADGGLVTTSSWTLYLAAADADNISTTSRVTLTDGTVLEVDAPPRAIYDARSGSVDHLEVAVRLVA